MEQGQQKTGYRTIGQEIIQSVAEAEGIEPEAVTPPLYRVVDPDALEQLFAQTESVDRRDGTVTFPYNGYEVSVFADGHVALEPLAGYPTD